MVDRKAALKTKPRKASAENPSQLIGMAYDLAVLACRREDERQSVRAVQLLRDALRSIGSQDSDDLQRFLDWCLERIGEGEFQIAEQSLSALRNAWKEAA